MNDLIYDKTEYPHLKFSCGRVILVHRTRRMAVWTMAG